MIGRPSAWQKLMKDIDLGQIAARLVSVASCRGRAVLVAARPRRISADQSDLAEVEARPAATKTCVNTEGIEPGRAGIIGIHVAFSERKRRPLEWPGSQ